MEKVIVNKGNDGNYWYSIPCIVCDESVRLTDDEYKMVQAGFKLRSKVCNECKQAVLHTRECMKIKVSDDNQNQCVDKADIFIITRHSFDLMENNLASARYTTFSNVDIPALPVVWYLTASSNS